MAGPYEDMSVDKFPAPSGGSSGGGSSPGGGLTSLFSDKQLRAGATGNIVSGALSSIWGLGQLLSGNDTMGSLDNPELHLDRYNVPDAYKNNATNTAMNYFNMTMPGQTTAENKISGVTSGNIKAATNSGSSGSDILSAISALDANEKNARNGIATSAAEFHNNNFDKTLQANRDLGQQEGFKETYDNTLKEKEFENNQLNPYLRSYQRGLEMQGAGTQNIMSGLTKGIGSAADLAMLFI